MIARILTILAALLIGSTATRAGETREIVDMAGRRVVIPAHPKRIYGSSPPVTLALYALAPDMLIGLNMPFRGDEKPYLRKEARNLPAIGSGSGMGRKINLEEVASHHPDLVIAWLDRFGASVAQAEATFARIGLPVVFVRLDTLADHLQTFPFLGELLGRKEKAAQFAAYIAESMRKVSAATANIPQSERARVYYAESADGLATDCDKSFHAEPINLAGGINVYHCEQTNHVGMDRIGLEQVVALKPTIIVAQDKRFVATARENSGWRNVPAVQKGRIVAIPHAPFNWLDRPPSFMRALGVQWLANVFYPTLYPLDLKSETKKFYRLFLGVDPSDAEFERIVMK